MANSQHYDAVVIGAGQGGSPLAGALAGSRTQNGDDRTRARRRHLRQRGLHPHQDDGRQREGRLPGPPSADYGVQNGHVAVEMIEVRQRKRDIVDSFRGGSERRLEDAENLDLIDGEASFIDPNDLEVTARPAADDPD